MEALGPNLDELSVSELLRLSRDILRQLRTRGIIRSSNAPAGDYAELLTQRLTDGELAPNSQKSWDVTTPSQKRLQVKARVLTPENPSGSSLRSDLGTLTNWSWCSSTTTSRSSVRCFSAPPLLKRLRYGVSTSTAGFSSRGTISSPTVKTAQARWPARSSSALHPSGC
jgi:hypothetical protein